METFIYPTSRKGAAQQLQSCCPELFLTVVCHIWHLETLPAVSLVGPELYPKPLGAGGESDGTLVRLTCLVGRHGVGQSCGAKAQNYKS